MAASYLCMVLILQAVFFAHSGTIKWKTNRETTNSQPSTKRLKIENRIPPAVAALQRHFKWKKIALVVGSEERYMHASRVIKQAFRNEVVSVTYEKPYYEFEDYPNIVDTLKNISCKASVIVLLIDIRTAKEYMEAAYESQLTDGSHLFVAFETNVSKIVRRQQRPFKWVSVEYCDGSFASFIARSYKLCLAWQSALIVMLNLPQHIIESKKKKASYKFHDSTEPEADIDFDFEQEFSGLGNSAAKMMPGAIDGTADRLDSEMMARSFRDDDVKESDKYSLSVYRYGVRNVKTCSNILTEVFTSPDNGDGHYPTMEELGEFKGKEKGEELKLKFNSYWKHSEVYRVAHAVNIFPKTC